MMKRITTGVLCVLMVLTMLFALAGCGSDSNKLVGTWEGVYSFDDVYNETFAAMGMDDNVIEGYDITVRFTFEKDGTYTLAPNEEATKESLKKLKDNLSDKELGEVIDLMFSDESLDSMVEETKEKGSWKIEDGKLYIASDGNAFDEDVYIAYTLSDSTLTLEEKVGAGIGDLSKYVFPATFKKVK